jgi:S1-C subfamily serine protease
MTVTRDSTSHRTAIVSRVASDGQAAQVGIQVGDVIIGVGNRWVESYDDFLVKIKEVAQYPVSLVIRRRR